MPTKWCNGKQHKGPPHERAGPLPSAHPGARSAKGSPVSAYLVIKWIHVLSSVLLVGTGFGSAYYLFFVNRRPSLAAKAVVARLVMRADLWFTTPAAVIQPATGLLMAYWAGWPVWSTPWLRWAIVLYIVAGACWLPVLWLQWRMMQIAEAALREGAALPAAYERYARWWTALGIPAFVAMLVVFYLMVAKPMGLA
jgi:uncharacterized membrane protein